MDHGPFWGGVGGATSILHQKLGKRPLRDAIPYVAREQLARDHTLLFSTWRPSPVQLHCRLGPHFLGRAGCGQLNSEAEQELTLSYKHAVYYSLPFVNARQAEPAPQQRHARSKGGGGNLGETIRIKLYITG